MRALFLVLALLFAFAHDDARAHDGHDLSRIAASAGALIETEAGFGLRLHLENGRETEIVLGAVFADAGMVALQGPVTLAPGAKVEVPVLIANGALPGIFTLVLDFGEAGYGPVTVISTDI